MHFLLIYDRSGGTLLSEMPFDDRTAAMQARFAAERTHRGDDNIEVVVLDAPSAETLRRTHARYFKSLTELAASSSRSRQIKVPS